MRRRRPMQCPTIYTTQGLAATRLQLQKERERERERERKLGRKNFIFLCNSLFFLSFLFFFFFFLLLLLLFAWSVSVYNPTITTLHPPSTWTSRTTRKTSLRILQRARQHLPIFLFLIVVVAALFLIGQLFHTTRRHSYLRQILVIDRKFDSFCCRPRTQIIHSCFQPNFPTMKMHRT